MALFKQVVDAYIGSKDLDESTISRLGFWVTELGDRELATITAEEIDAALVKLAARGRLHGGKTPHGRRRQAARRLYDEPLSHPGRLDLQARKALEACAARFRRPHAGYRTHARAS